MDQKFGNLINNIKEIAHRFSATNSSRQKEILLIEFAREIELFLKLEYFSANQENGNDLSLHDLFLLVKDANNLEKNVFHRLKYLANAAKHDPNFRIEPDHSILIKDFISTLEKRTSLNVIAETKIIRPRLSNIELWFSAWDHFLGGDMELHLYHPMIELPYAISSFDMIYIDMKKWDELIADLKLNVKIDLYRPSLKVPSELINFNNWCAKEGDLGFTGKIGGHYKHIIRILSRYELRNELLPGLMREHSYYSLKVACLFSSIDTYSSYTKTQSLEHWVQLVLTSLPSYAMPISDEAEQTSRTICTFFSTVLGTQFLKTIGPVRFITKSAMKSHSEYLGRNLEEGILLKKDGEILFYR